MKILEVNAVKYYCIKTDEDAYMNTYRRSINGNNWERCFGDTWEVYDDAEGVKILDSLFLQFMQIKK